MRMSKKITGKNKGQILIMAIFVFIIIFMITFLVIETGNLIYKKIHMQNICDSAALEGGLWYARILNIVSLTNKGLATAYGLTIISLGTLKAGVDIVKKIQNGITSISPYFIYAMVLLNGYENKVLSVPLFNKEAGESDSSGSNKSFSLPDLSSVLPDILEKIDFNNDFLNTIKNFSNSASENDYSIIPNLNLRRQTATQILETEVKYYYIHRDKKIYVDASNVSYNSKARRWQMITPVMTENGNRKYFVTREVINKYGYETDKVEDMTFFIEEKGPHYIWVASLKWGNEFLVVKNFFKDEKRKEIKANNFFLTVSKVVIDGGSMDVQDLNGAKYSPRIERAGLPFDTGMFDEKLLNKFLLH